MAVRGRLVHDAAMMRTLWIVAALVLALTLPAGVVSADERHATAPPESLVVLARTGPWPVNSALIPYRGAIWFTNSVKGVNHNSADIWRLDPATGHARYQRGLFSQDSGPPLRHRGHLYWPFEDGRAGSLGVAAVTDGTNWQEVLIPGVRAFHLHAMAEWRGALVAVTAAINAGLHLSQDGGRSWRTLIDLAPRVGRFVRLDAVVVAGGRLFLRLDEADGASLVEYRDGRLDPVPGWPKLRWLADPVAVVDGVAALVWGHEDGPITLFDGSRSRALPAPEPGAALHALHAEGNDLYAAGLIGDRGVVWRRDAAGAWTRQALFSGGTPEDLTVMDGRVYVAGAGDDGRGILWGPAGQGAAVTAPGVEPPAPMPPQFPDLAPADWGAKGEALRALLGRPETYDDHGRAVQAALLDAVRRGPPEGLLRELLREPFPAGTVPTYGGRGQAVRAEMAAWYILWAMGLARQPDVPVEVLQSDWTRAPNGPEKWFDPLLIGLWAAGNAGQRDRATLAALTARLDRDDPVWLRGQVVATLTAVTGCAFGHDADAWRDWWRQGGTPCQ